MIQNEKIVIFDFCETLANFQTADAFVDYVRIHLNDKKINSKENFFCFVKKYKILYPFCILEYLMHQTWSLSKRLKLWELKGVSEDIITNLSLDYYNMVIKPNLIPETISLLRQHQNDGYDVWLVSGGYGVYLRHFIKEYHIRNLISSNIEIKNGKCTGRLNGLDCVNNNKTKLLNKKYQGEVCASYSDSITDLPILKISENPIVVSRKHQLWATEQGFKEIIWNK